MKSLLRFLLGLLMPLILIAGGGALIGWGVTHDWPIMIWTGLAMIGAGILWGLFLFLWASEGPL